ncbi:hypothetical protein GCM10023186_23530 [Hymenobacter koreensis]|uniref:Uncharacterized protein n=1 Tax=Hymenobacter koreensis TaxID=1084523 RepID=A0ABP8J0P6_9BACT
MGPRGGGAYEEQTGKQRAFHAKESRSEAALPGPEVSEAAPYLGTRKYNARLTRAATNATGG